jgi:hypothetical protein
VDFDGEATKANQAAIYRFLSRLFVSVKPKWAEETHLRSKVNLPASHTLDFAKCFEILNKL